MRYLVFCAILATCLLSSCGGKEQKEQETVAETASTNDAVNDSIAYERYVRQMVWEYDSIGKLFDSSVCRDDTSKIINSVNQIISLNDLSGDFDIIARYSVANCTDCIGHMLDCLLDYKEHNENAKIAVVIQGGWYRDLHVYNAKYKDLLQFYACENLSTDYEEYFEPYFVKTQQDKIEYLFIPAKEMPQRTLSRLNLKSES